MSEKRLGRQTPTTSLVLPYTETKGREAVEIYNKTGRTAREWQEILIYDILAIRRECGCILFFVIVCLEETEKPRMLLCGSCGV